MKYHIGDVGIAMQPGPKRPVLDDIGRWRVQTLTAIRDGVALPGLVLVGRTSMTTYEFIEPTEVNWETSGL